MRVLITGGAGLVGKPVSEKFVRKGWDVRVIGIEPDCDIDGVTYTQCDILDFGALSKHVEGCDAIVHLAAIASTPLKPIDVIFNVNVSGTYNVFEAADRAGVKRIAQASSINALGSYWGCDDRRFDYFPLDEDHPLHTTDAYSFSKQLVEEIAEYYWRRSGISSASFRLPAVWSDEVIAARNLRKKFREQRDHIEAFRLASAAEQQARMEKAREQALALRARHIMEYDAIQASEFDRDAPDDWLFHSYFFDRFNYWTFIHTDDSTQAFEKALTADYEGVHALFVNSDRNFLGYDAETLLALFFPDVSRRAKTLAGDESLVNIQRARQLIGFAPTVRSIL